MNIDFDFEKLASAGEKIINAAGAHPVGACIIVVGLLGGYALWIWSNKE